MLNELQHSGPTKTRYAQLPALPTCSYIQIHQSLDKSPKCQNIYHNKNENFNDLLDPFKNIENL